MKNIKKYKKKMIHYISVNINQPQLSLSLSPLSSLSLPPLPPLSLSLILWSVFISSLPTPPRRSTPFDFSLHSIPPHCTRPSRRAHTRKNIPRPLNLSFRRPFHRKGREATPCLYPSLARPRRSSPCLVFPPLPLSLPF